MKKSIILIMIITIFSKFSGLFRDIVLSYFYGATNISDAYLISQTIPVSIFAFIGVGISTTFIPLYNEIESKKKSEAESFTNNVINISLTIATLFIIISFLFSGTIVKLFASGFDKETLKIAVNFTRISIFGIYFSIITSIMSSYLSLKNNFALSALIGIPFNLIIVVSIVLSNYYNMYFIVLGTLIATASQLLIVVPASYRYGYKYQFILEPKDTYIRKMLTLTLPIILGTGVNQINQIVDRTMASRTAIGGISSLNYAHLIDGFVQGIFVMSLITVLYPHISKMIINGNLIGFKKNIIDTINLINLFMIPITIGTLIFSKQIIEIIFARGAFDSNAISMTSNALFYYSFGMAAFGLRQILSRAFYALQDTKTPMVNATIGVVINIILNIILSQLIGVGGLALATSISSWVTSILLFIKLRKKIGPFGIKNMVISTFKVLFASLSMGLFVKLIYFILIASSFGQNISLLITILLGILLYLFIIFFMKIEIVDNYIYLIKHKYKNKKYID